jgi:K+-transporting ATPase KdpF subunit
MMMNSIFLTATAKSIEMDNSAGYIIGAVIAVLILGYLLYPLVKPEKF